MKLLLAATLALAVAGPVLAQTAAPVPSPSAEAPTPLGGVTVQAAPVPLNRVHLNPRHQCGPKEEACIDAVVAALQGLKGKDHEVFRAWCLNQLWGQAGQHMGIANLDPTQVPPDTQLSEPVKRACADEIKLKG